MACSVQDHLICFLPGALALDVFHHAARRFNGTAVQPHQLDRDRAMELTLAHKLLERMLRTAGMYRRMECMGPVPLTKSCGPRLMQSCGSYAIGGNVLWA